MTTQAMIDMVDALLTTHLNSYLGDAPTNAQKITVLNWAQRTVAKKIRHFDPNLALTLVQGAFVLNTYTMATRRVIRPHKVVVNGNPLRAANGVDYGVWSWREFEARHSRWRSEPSGPPILAAWTKQKMAVWPPPTAAVVSAGDSWISGEIFPADLSASDLLDECELPEEAHEGVCLLAAVRQAVPTLSEEHAWAMVREFGALALAEIDRLEMEASNDLMPWGSTPSGDSEFMFL